MMVSGLKQGEAVKFGDVYVVALAAYGREYLVNGVRVNGTSQVTVSDLNDIKQIVPSVKKVTHYERADGAVLSLEEHSAKVNESQKYWQEGIEDYVYPDLETEFEVRKKTEALDAYRPVFQQSPEGYQPYTVNLLGSLEDSGSKYIECSLNYGMSSFSRGGLYKVGSLVSMAVDEANSVIKEYDSELKVKVNGKLCFVTVGDKYIFKDINTSDRLFTNLSDAKKFEADFRKDIRSTVLPYVRVKVIESTERSELLYSLTLLKENVLRMQVKQASPVTRGGIATRLQSLIDSLKA